MKHIGKTLIIMSLALTAMGSAWSADSEQIVRGRDLMTPAEHAAHHQAMLGMTPWQRRAYRQQVHEQLEERAEAAGVALQPFPHKAGLGADMRGYGQRDYGLARHASQQGRHGCAYRAGMKYRPHPGPTGLIIQ